MLQRLVWARQKPLLGEQRAVVNPGTNQTGPRARIGRAAARQ